MTNLYWAGVMLFEFIILIFNVFFFSVVEGNQIKVGEKVYCECQYSEHLPFKWNATKVQLIQSQLTYTSTPSNQVFVSHPFTPQFTSQQPFNRPKGGQPKGQQRESRWNQSSSVKRYYDVINIPKFEVLKSHLNYYDVKQRYSQSIHIPSDFKQINVSNSFEFSIKTQQKPIQFKIIKSEPNTSPLTTPTVTSSNESQHKFAVKILLISLPSKNDIFDRVFGAENESSKQYFVHLNKLIALIVNKNSNEGFSLIGTKYNPQLDGHHSDGQPNLIKTAIRCCYEHLNLNLSKCSKWHLIGSFEYNRDTSLDPINPNKEFIKVFLPEFWCCNDLYEPIEWKQNQVKQEVEEQEYVVPQENDENKNESNNCEVKQQDNDQVINDQQQQSQHDKDQQQQTQCDVNIENDNFNDERLNQLTVQQLKFELEKRKIKVKSNQRKAELVQILKQHINDANKDDVIGDVKGDWWTQKVINESMKAKNDEIIKDEMQVINDEIDPINDEHNQIEQQNVNDKDENEKIDKQEKVEIESDKIQVDKSETQENEQQKVEEQSSKRKIDDETDLNELKKRKTLNEFVIRTSNDSLQIIQLNEALNHQRYDQFELAICTELLREHLIRSNARHIFSALFSDKQINEQQNEEGKDVKPNEVKQNYVQLAFSYFDVHHCGHLLSDDLIKLFCNSNISLSKRCFNLLINSQDKVTYKHLTEPKQQFDWTSNDVTSSIESHFEFNSILKENQKMSAQLSELNEKIDELNEEINKSSERTTELNDRIKRMIQATDKQNDEICELKREKETLKHKNESLKRSIESALSTLKPAIE